MESSCTARPDSGSQQPGETSGSGRKEKRKARKKIKRKKCRQRIAEAERLREEVRLQDPEELLRIRKALELEAQREELERKLHEEEERRWLERERQAQEEFQRREQERLSKQKEVPLEKQEKEEEEDGEYEDGPAEIIWEGNEITIRKTRVKVGAKVEKPEVNTKERKDDRPTRNPSPPPRLALPRKQSYDGIEQVANYGTEQDKTHCPFHTKTGACRFGPRCSRLHVYPEKSCTLLIKNMYTGPGLAWEHDEGLECTDEEIEEKFEEFYEDVHSEFLKFGELVNFKVCRNSSPHLRGNVYVHYQSEEDAVAACLALSGRFYASKQMIPEFVRVSKWKAALCGEYMKAHQTCSRGTACNFLHCFRNPGGEYEWADREGPPPRSWKQKMASLFGLQVEEVESRSRRDHQRRDKEQRSDHRRHSHSSRENGRRYDQARGSSYRSERSHHSGENDRKHRKREEDGSDRDRKRSCRSDRGSRNGLDLERTDDDDGGRWLD
ncbi:zinc finger CCCH domain-containing protein 5 [Selaginella moellendorffii]|uniref:zinc finger CCCH domain-containing protein 5 n=1 Tax=Selaginella moellendorffii TaxID=88036 RepID=UPI000D1C8A25|nr:zinc finger CCCH domain-containing protein 5 [Selaginella moellendorffii]|eukprot:XP_002971007.2 zinc finger CCCH domain-containing protein 5 [Selaginella moellendorffii]